MIEHVICDKKIGSDINEYLIAMWNALKNGYLPPKDITKEEYLEVKNNIDSYPKEHVAIVGFCATYNGGWFRRYGGKAITKSGKVRNYYDEGVRNILKQVPKIMDVEFVHSDYRDLNIPINSLVYCDIPYESSKYEMYEDKFNHSLFWDWCSKTSTKNIVLISEYHAPEDFVCIFEKVLTTTFDNKGRKKDTEKLFIHKSRYNDVRNIINDLETAI